LNEKSLPPIESFFNKLNDEGISKTDYLRACKLWDSLPEKTFKAYHYYVMSSSILLPHIYGQGRLQKTIGIVARMQRLLAAACLRIQSP
jgi:hypothetical protein